MRVVSSAEVSLLVVALDTMHRAFASEILTPSLVLSLESHRHLRISIIESIVGEFATVLLTCSLVIRFSATSHVVHPHILRRQPW
jgi:hypothetical protein